jgi:hypothetical protein
MPTQESTLDQSATAPLQKDIDKQERRPKLFIFRRRPHVHIPREFPPMSDEEYERKLIGEGFISTSMISDEVSEEMRVDLRELEQHLMPHFWRLDQQARFFQNKFYQYQWAFILAAFFTTTLAAISVLIFALNKESAEVLGLFKWTEVLGLCTAIMSGIAASVSFLDANQTPQQRWFRARTQAESLRSLYFIYLARQAPFDTPDTRERVQRLRRKVLDVLRELFQEQAAHDDAHRRKPDETTPAGSSAPSEPTPEAEDDSR